MKEISHEKPLVYKYISENSRISTLLELPGKTTEIIWKGSNNKLNYNP